MGVVKYILNDNFALLHGPVDKHAGFVTATQNYCLFDTYDLHLTSEETAAEKGLGVDKVLKIGDTVLYHACLVNDSKFQNLYLTI